jgi:hypothetical protein
VIEELEGARRETEGMLRRMRAMERGQQVGGLGVCVCESVWCVGV